MEYSILYVCYFFKVARKLAMVEGDLQRAEERAEAGESKIVDLEEELRQIGKSLLFNYFYDWKQLVFIFDAPSIRFYNKIWWWSLEQRYIISYVCSL